MTDTMQRRGPDASGAWLDAERGFVMGHRRLSVVELSSAGSQPMASASGRFILSFNGEIYNHWELRRELEGETGVSEWRGDSDTETLLAAIEHWGLVPALQRSVGMFAIALWDRRSSVLHLARDRFGEKPLYYGVVDGSHGPSLLFGSELAAILAVAKLKPRVCQTALRQFIQYSHVPAPRSIYEGIFKLEPGGILTARAPPSKVLCSPLRPGDSDGQIEVQRWWSSVDVARDALAAPISDPAEAVSMLEKQLLESIRLQSLADVPVGAFLSGGIDSSLVVALMQQQARGEAGSTVQTFTVAFQESDFNEGEQASAVAKALGTDHRELMLSHGEAQEIVLALPNIYSEPFADSSQIAMHLVCRAARQNVTVALSGDGADELFGGYNRYAWAPRLWNQVRHIPKPIKGLAGSIALSVPQPWWDRLGQPLGLSRFGDKVHRIAPGLRDANSVEDLYLGLLGNADWSSRVLRSTEKFADSVEEAVVSGAHAYPPAEVQSRMMLWDTLSYLPDDILCKVDRAAMYTSLETRAPFLDHRVAELAWRLPSSLKIQGNTSKWPLRQILYRYVPKELIERPKAGFAVPIGNWLRKELRSWADDLLALSRLDQEGFFDARLIRQVWAEHLSGRRDWTSRLWPVLMFQAWWVTQRT